MSQVDQKRAFNKLKHDLEPFRNLLIHLQSILNWEKKFYPAAIYLATTFFFLILWALDLSTITLLALGGLLVVAFDLIYSSVSRMLFNPNNWNGQQEEEFERVCSQLCAIKLAMDSWYEYLFTYKERKSTGFVIIMCVFFIVLAWIGAVINNLLLMYLLTIAIIMYPGIQNRNVFEIIKTKFGCVVNSKIQQLREKTKKSD